MSEPTAGILFTPTAYESSTVPEGATIDFLVPHFQDVAELRASIKRPAILPLGVVRAPGLSAPELRPIADAYLAPAIARRHREAPEAWPLPVAVRSALIALPLFEGGPFRVYLNDEVAVLVKARTKYGALQQGDMVTLDNIVGLSEASFRDVDIAAEPFVWFQRTGEGVTCYFSFGPAIPHVVAQTSGVPVEDVASEWEERLAELTRSVRDVIAQDVLRAWFRDALPDDPAVRDAMLADGWFPAPSLVPTPWAAMCAAYARGAPEEATALAVNALPEPKLQAMLEAWTAREPFTQDGEFLRAAVRHYVAGDYLASAAIAIPRVEGLVNRMREMRGAGATRRFAKVFKQIEQLGDAEAGAGWLSTQFREGFAGFIDEYFDAHFDPADPQAGSTRGRHAHAHGATRFELYDARHALQILLVFDALFFMTAPA